MENKNEQIANLQLHISEDCSEIDKTIIKLYWKFKNLDFINSPRSIQKKFDITQSQLIKIINSHTTITFYAYCKSCNSYEKHIATSQSNFNQTVSHQRSRISVFKCEHCKELERAQNYLEQKKKDEEFNQKLNDAIVNKNWEQLSIFEKKLLGNSLEMDFDELKKHYYSKLGQSHYYKFIRALENIENQNLLILYRDTWHNNYIINRKFLPKLLEYKDEINFVEEKPQNSVTVDEETNTIKLKLTVNETQNHPDSPMFAGTVTFQEKIVIEPGVEYIFGHWQRANNNLYLTLTPLENMDKLPSQKRVSNLPVSMQKGVTDFLNNLGKNLNFE